MDGQIKRILINSISSFNQNLRKLIDPAQINVQKLDNQLYKLTYNNLFVSLIKKKDLDLVKTVNFKNMSTIKILKEFFEKGKHLIKTVCLVLIDTDCIDLIKDSIKCINNQRSETHSLFIVDNKNLIPLVIEEGKDFILVEKGVSRGQSINIGLHYVKKIKCNLDVILLTSSSLIDPTLVTVSQTISQKDRSWIVGANKYTYVSHNINYTLTTEKERLSNIGFLFDGIYLTKSALSKANYTLLEDTNDIILSINKKISSMSPIKCSINSQSCVLLMEKNINFGYFDQALTTEQSFRSRTFVSTYISFMNREISKPLITKSINPPIKKTEKEEPIKQKQKVETIPKKSEPVKLKKRNRYEFVNYSIPSKFNQIFGMVYVVTKSKKSIAYKKIRRNLNTLCINHSIAEDTFNNNKVYVDIIKDGIENNHKSIFILNDGIVFHKNFSQIIENIKNPPKDFDLIYFTNYKNDKKEEFNIVNILDNIHFAFGISKGIYRGFIDYLDKEDLASLQQKLHSRQKSYVFHESLIIPNGDHLIQEINQNDRINYKNYNFRLAIIIPYRDRSQHLSQLLHHMDLYLTDIDYSIFIIHQDNNRLFCRGTLFNIGFHILKDQYDYFCFHDVDLIPEESGYYFTNTTRHLSKYVSQFNYQVPYEMIFGGVNIINKRDFVKCNGFTNMAEGRGIEDDNLRERMIFYDIEIDRPDYFYNSLPHTTISNPLFEINSKRLYHDFRAIENKRSVIQSDGLNMLGKKFMFHINGIKKLDNKLPIYMVDVDFESQYHKYKLTESECLRLKSKKYNMNDILPYEIDDDIDLRNVSKFYNSENKPILWHNPSIYIPEISIIIPIQLFTDNTKKMVNSLLNQTLKNIEIILVTDNENNITKYFNDGRIVELQSDSDCPIKGINSGFDISKGRYITWITEDCTWGSKTLCELMRVLEVIGEIDFVYTGHKYKNDVFHGKMINPRDLVFNFRNIKCFLMRREQVQQIGLLDNTLDYMATFDYILRGIEINPVYASVPGIKCVHLCNNVIVPNYNIYGDRIANKMLERSNDLIRVEHYFPTLKTHIDNKRSYCQAYFTLACDIVRKSDKIFGNILIKNAHRLFYLSHILEPSFYPTVFNYVLSLAKIRQLNPDSEVINRLQDMDIDQYFHFQNQHRKIITLIESNKIQNIKYLDYIIIDQYDRDLFEREKIYLSCYQIEDIRDMNLPYRVTSYDEDGIVNPNNILTISNKSDMRKTCFVQSSNPNDFLKYSMSEFNALEILLFSKTRTKPSFPCNNLIGTFAEDGDLKEYFYYHDIPVFNFSQKPNRSLDNSFVLIMDKVTQRNKEFYTKLADTFDFQFVFYRSSLTFKHPKCQFVNHIDFNQCNILFVMVLFNDLRFVDLLQLLNSGPPTLCKNGLNISNYVLQMDTGLIVDDEQLESLETLTPLLYDVQDLKNGRVISNFYSRENLLKHNCLVYRLIFEWNKKLNEMV